MRRSVYFILFFISVFLALFSFLLFFHLLWESEMSAFAPQSCFFFIFLFKCSFFLSVCLWSFCRLNGATLRAKRFLLHSLICFSKSFLRQFVFLSTYLLFFSLFSSSVKLSLVQCCQVCQTTCISGVDFSFFFFPSSRKLLLVFASPLRHPLPWRVSLILPSYGSRPAQ